MTDTELRRVLDLERDVQTASTRADPERLRRLLSPAFVEIGASGRRWDRDAILEVLAREGDAPETPPIEIIGLDARRLAPDLVQTFWDSRRGDRRARRSSLWRREGSDWRQVFHQGTPLP